MAHLISFQTSIFDISQEAPNPLNPIAGQSMLFWLKHQLINAQYKVTEPDAEDWGWYIVVSRMEESYLVGASAETDNTNLPIDWVIQVHKNRSLKDKIFGKSKLLSNDPLFVLIENLICNDSNFENIEVDYHV
jgi:hypothetical protein